MSQNNILCIMICKAALQKSILVECTTDLLKVSFGGTPTYLQICIKVSFKHGMVHRYSCYGGNQAPVVQTLDSAIHRINHYPADKY